MQISHLSDSGGLKRKYLTPILSCGLYYYLMLMVCVTVVIGFMKWIWDKTSNEIPTSMCSYETCQKFFIIYQAIIWIIQVYEVYITPLLYIDILIIWKKNLKKIKITISKSKILNCQCKYFSLTETFSQSIWSLYDLHFHSSINNNKLRNATCIYWSTVFK